MLQVASVKNSMDSTHPFARIISDVAKISLGYQLRLMKAIFMSCSNDKRDDVISLMVELVSLSDQGMALLKNVVSVETDKDVDGAGQVLRGNDMATLLISAFLREEGKEYLCVVLSPLIEDLRAGPQKSELRFDLDISELGKRMNAIEKNIWDLFARMRATPLPDGIQTLARHLFQCVEDRFPAQGVTTVCSTLVLRFISPVLIHPELIGYDPVGIDKNAVEYAKIIQMMATKKEETSNFPPAIEEQLRVVLVKGTAELRSVFGSLFTDTSAPESMHAFRQNKSAATLSPTDPFASRPKSFGLKRKHLTQTTVSVVQSLQRHIQEHHREIVARITQDDDEVADDLFQAFISIYGYPLGDQDTYSMKVKPLL